MNFGGATTLNKLKEDTENPLQKTDKKRKDTDEGGIFYIQEI